MIALLATATAANAQQAITIVGGDAESSSGSISLSCGEVAVQHSVAKAITVVNITSYFTEGVQQSFAGSRTDIASPLPFTVSVGPNPTHSHVEITVADGTWQSLSYSLYTMKGETVRRAPIEGGRTSIDLSGMPAGTYLLHVEENIHASEANVKKNKNIYKIIKAN